jgi:hypothetical protein
VIVLVFTLVTYYDTATSPWLASFARGVVAAVNVKLVENALKVRKLGHCFSHGSHPCLERECGP